MSPPPETSSAAELLGALLADRHDGTHLRAVRTGFKALDHALGGGLRTGELVVVGGLPGVGKSVAGLQWSRALASAGESVLYACYEHSAVDLLVRLVALELGENEDDGSGVEALTQQMHVNGGTSGSLARAAEHPAVATALEAVATAGDRLRLHAANAGTDDIAYLARLADACAADVIVVDYLQKVPAAEEGTAGESVVGALKTLAMASDRVVIAIASCDDHAIDARRTRMHHLRDAASVSHEADVVIMVNDKARAVADVHLQYDELAAARHREGVVLSIEKNRRGPAGIDLQFRKDLAHFRFDPYGTVVEERLVDDLR